jgi:GNAT superfamily N-acetyltransferase
MDRRSPGQPLADPGALLATTHEIRGGLRVRLRLARPSDGPRVRAFLERLSPETRRRRFFAAQPTIAEPLVRHFTFFDPRERLVVAATTPLGGSEDVVALADLVLLATGLAELAIVVDDRFQRRGLGALLSEVMASLAIRAHATHLKGELLSDNAPMLRLMERLGPTVRSLEQGSATVYTTLPTGGHRAA